MKYPYMQWFTHDWLSDPAVSLCSPATRGVWIDLLSAMHERDRSGELSGTRDQLARIGRCSTVELAQALTELQTTQAADVTERNGVVTVRNRRMYREAKSRNCGTLRVQSHREKRRCNAGETPHSTEFIFQKSESSSNTPPPPPTPPVYGSGDGQPAAATAAVELLLAEGMTREFADLALAGLSAEQCEVVVKGALKDLRRYQKTHAFETPADRGRWLTGAIRKGKSGWLSAATAKAKQQADSKAQWDNLEAARAADQARYQDTVKLVEHWNSLTSDRQHELARMAAAINWPTSKPEEPNIRRFIERQATSQVPCVQILELLKKEMQ